MVYSVGWIILFVVLVAVLGFHSKVPAWWDGACLLVFILWMLSLLTGIIAYRKEIVNEVKLFLSE